MTAEERIQLDAKLKKLFPKHPNVQFNYQHIYGYTMARLRFNCEFDVTQVRAMKVKAGLMSLRSLLDVMIENIPEDQDDES